jgi:uncharacterized protein (TIGR03435 family)
MTKTLLLASLAGLATYQGHCADVGNAPSFEVASITPCKPGTQAPPMEHAGMVQFVYPGGRFNAKATSIKYLIEWAYDIQPAQHSDGPSWLDTDRYDIVAKAEGNATEDQMRRLVQALLEDRFKLKVRREQRKLPVYVIAAGKTPPKLYPPKEGETHAIKVGPRMGPDGKPQSVHVEATRFSLAQLTNVFSRQLGRPIVNQTGLTGEYDFTLDLMTDEHQPNPLDPSLLITAMKEQLGLALKAENALTDFLVIEGIEKVEAGN